MIITKLEDFVGKEVELLISGHFITGRITEVDPASDSFVFLEDDGETTSSCTIDAGSVALIKGN